MTSVIWISYSTKKDQIKPKIRSLEIVENDANNSPKIIKEKILSLFNLDFRLAARLRRNNGNLVPINEFIPINRKKTAYDLEVFLPIVRKVIITNDHDFMLQEERLTTAFAKKNIINYYIQRVTKLESIYQASYENLFESFKKQIDDIEDRIQFIENRVSDTKSKQWSGVFKRPLLW